MRAEYLAVIAREALGGSRFTREPEPEVMEDKEQVEAFALLDPPDRLALLYCRGRSSRQGRATALLQALQSHAFSQGVGQLRTEASQLSRPLLERQGWRLEAEETAWYDGVAFQRWRMLRDLA